MVLISQLNAIVSWLYAVYALKRNTLPREPLEFLLILSTSIYVASSIFKTTTDSKTMPSPIYTDHTGKSLYNWYFYLTFI